MILLCGEFAQLTPADVPVDEWKGRLDGIAEKLTVVCRDVDPQSTDEILSDSADEAV